MRRLQDSILFLVLHLTLVFNIERIDIDRSNAIDLATPLYLLTILAVVMILLIRWMKTLPPVALILLWAAIYFVVKLLFVAQRPLAGGIFTYLSFTELGLLLVAVFLAQNVALNLEEYEQALKNFAFATNSKIHRVQEAQEKIQAEIYRSRRFQRPLSIIVLESDINGKHSNIDRLVQDAQRTFLVQYISTMMARELSSQLRQTDLLLEHDKKGRLVIISPDTDQAGIVNMISRLRTLTNGAEYSVNFGTATFPSHGLTFEQLLEQAEVNLQQLNNGGLKINSIEDEKNQALKVE